MNQEKIIASLDAMLENPKAKPFLNHVVKSYVPLKKVVKVMDTPTEKFKCVITTEPLCSVSDILNTLESQEYKDAFLKSLKNVLSDKDTVKDVVTDLLNGKKLGVTGADTTTYMSLPTFFVFYDWVITKSLTGNKHINWLLGGIRHKAFLERAEKIANGEVQAKVSKMKKTDSGAKRASYTLADVNNGLAALKAKMEAEEI
jgi:hypothetical protein